MERPSAVWSVRPRVRFDTEQICGIIAPFWKFKKNWNFGKVYCEVTRGTLKIRIYEVCHDLSSSLGVYKMQINKQTKQTPFPAYIFRLMRIES